VQSKAIPRSDLNYILKVLYENQQLSAAVELLDSLHDQYPTWGRVMNDLLVHQARSATVEGLIAEAEASHEENLALGLMIAYVGQKRWSSAIDLGESLASASIEPVVINVIKSLCVLDLKYEAQEWVEEAKGLALTEDGANRLRGLCNRYSLKQ
jgi:hypothetical protein